jgi:NADH-quinone oxidoreductase subunit M
MKKLVAYSSVSHLGFCVLGIFALNQTAIEGSILQMVNHGLSTGALFLLVGVVYERRHTRLLADYGGLAETMPVYATLFVIAMLSSVGLPGLNGFIGEFLILSGTFQTHPTAAVLAASGVILAAIYLLWLVQKVFYGPITNEENKHVPEIAWNEIAALVPLIVLMVWIGVHPNTFLKRMSPSVQELVSVVKQEKGVRVIQARSEERGARSAELRRTTLRAPGSDLGAPGSALPAPNSQLAGGAQ